MSDGHKEAVDIQGFLFLCFYILHNNAGHFFSKAFFLADNFNRYMVPHHFDVRGIQYFFLHCFGCTQFVAAVDHINFVAKLGQVCRLLGSGISPANDGYIFSFIKETVTGGTGRYAIAIVF